MEAKIFLDDEGISKGYGFITFMCEDDVDITFEIVCTKHPFIVNWLVEVAEEYTLLPQTLRLDVNYIDRFLSVCQ